MGLHQRYATILGNKTLTLAAPIKDELREELRKKFAKMMSALFKQKGANFDINIIASDEAQDFINTHTSVLDSSFQKVEMSDLMRQRLTRSNYIFSLHISYSPVMRMNQRLFCRKYVESYEYLHFENQRCPSRC